MCITIRASLTLEFSWINWVLRAYSLWDKKIKLFPSIFSPRPAFTSLVKRTLTCLNAARNAAYLIFQCKKAPSLTLKLRKTKLSTAINQKNRNLPQPLNRRAPFLTSRSSSCASFPWDMSSISCSRCPTSATPHCLKSWKLKTLSIGSSVTYRFTWKTRQSKSIYSSGIWLRDFKRRIT